MYYTNREAELHVHIELNKNLRYVCLSRKEQQRKAKNTEFVY